MPGPGTGGSAVALPGGVAGASGREGMVVATITNTGRLPVTIQRCQWQTSQPGLTIEAPNTPPGVSFPHRLGENDQCGGDVRATSWNRDHKSLRAEHVDSSQDRIPANVVCVLKRFHARQGPMRPLPHARTRARLPLAPGRGTRPGRRPGLDLLRRRTCLTRSLRTPAPAVRPPRLECDQRLTAR
jgi:hypothetical protein